MNQPRPGGTRPFPAYGAIAFGGPFSRSSYNALQLRAEKRFSDGFTFLANYAFGKSIDDTSAWLGSLGAGNGRPQDSQDRRAERGLSDFDSRHRFVLSYVWEVPSGRGRWWGTDSGFANALLGGWQTSGILTF